MSDLFNMPDVTIQAPHVATHVKHVIHSAPHLITPIKQGYSMITTLISSAVTGGIMFGLGWYIKGRGMAGVQIDMNNIKTDIVNIKAKLSAPTPAPVA